MAEKITYTDEELIQLLKCRDPKGFSYLYDNYAKALYGIITRMVKETGLAEDILQEVFIKVWSNIHQFNSEKGRLFTWMSNVAKNLTIDTMRSKNYKKQQKIAVNNSLIDNYYDKSYRLNKFDTIGLRNQLSHLKPMHKNVIDLAYFSGFTQEEISKVIGIPLGTVKTKMRSAILELRNVIMKDNCYITYDSKI